MAVAFDAVSAVQKGTAVGSLSWSHTASGSNRVVYVTVSWLNWPSGDYTCSVTYGGTSMTEIGSATAPTSGNRVKTFRLKNPATGSQTVAVTLAGTDDSYVVAGSSSWTGVDQTTPESAVTTNSGTGTAFSVSQAGSTAGNQVYGGMCGSYYPTGITSNQTQLWCDAERSGGNGHWGGAEYTSAGGAKTMSWAANASDYWAAMCFEILAAAGGSASAGGTTAMMGV